MLGDFRRWLRVAPIQADSLIAQTAVVRMLSQLTDVQRAELEALTLSEPRRAEVIPLSTYMRTAPASMRPERPKPRWTTWAAVSAALVSATMVVALVTSEKSGTEYTSGIGERRVIPLMDGSILTMNTQSRVRVKFTAQAREVELHDGEALFEVAHDARRPFRVRARRATIEAVGTQFSVYTNEEETRVAVLEGRVKLFEERRAVPLSAGEETSLTQHGEQRQKLSTEEIERRHAWTDGRVVFTGETLAQAVEVFNRYNRRQLRIADRSIEGLRVGGTFRTLDVEGFLAALHAVFGIQATDAGPLSNGQGRLSLRSSPSHTSGASFPVAVGRGIPGTQDKPQRGNDERP
jgi:transmembrane sensor